MKIVSGDIETGGLDHRETDLIEVCKLVRTRFGKP